MHHVWSITENFQSIAAKKFAATVPVEIFEAIESEYFKSTVKVLLSRLTKAV